MTGLVQRRDIEDTIRSLLREITGNSEFLSASASDSFETLGLDSIGMIELVYAVERAFPITIEDEEVLPENFESIGCLAAFIERKLTTAGTAG